MQFPCAGTKVEISVMMTRQLSASEDSCDYSLPSC